MGKVYHTVLKLWVIIIDFLTTTINVTNNVIKKKKTFRFLADNFFYLQM